jgi:hypothetical protein
MTAQSENSCTCGYSEAMMQTERCRVITPTLRVDDGLGYRGEREPTGGHGSGTPTGRRVTTSPQRGQRKITAVTLGVTESS